MFTPALLTKADSVEVAQVCMKALATYEFILTRGQSLTRLGFDTIILSKVG